MEKEKGYLWQGVQNKRGEYSYLITECGAHLYDHFGNAGRRDGCICPKCGKTIKIIRKKCVLKGELQ